jgi:hypothetical protein
VYGCRSRRVYVCVCVCMDVCPCVVVVVFVGGGDVFRLVAERSQALYIYIYISTHGVHSAVYLGLLYQTL